MKWQGIKKGSDPEWGTGRFIAMTLRRGYDADCLFVAFNTRHEGAVVDLPAAGPGREWRLVLDTGKPAPYDFLAVDESLSPENAAAALAQAAAWTTQSAYAMLPWSCVVLESVGEGLEEDACAIDRWDGMRTGSDEIVGAPGVPPPAEADTPTPPPPPPPPAGDIELTFGEGLREQREARRPGEPTEGRTPRATSQARPMPSAAAPYSSPADRHQPQASREPSPPPPPPQGARGAAEDWGPEEAELRALAVELLGSTTDLDRMSPNEKNEMLKILRENLELRKRLE